MTRRPKRHHRRHSAGRPSGWVGFLCLFLATALAGQGGLPLLHVVASHSHQATCCKAIPDTRAADRDGQPGSLHGTCPNLDDERSGTAGRCVTCNELLLAKLVVPWAPPLFGLLPERLCYDLPPAPQSRALPVERAATPARGPPAHA
jgi:hypothetical protein